MQEHIRRAHPEHYIAKLPATEESFLLMISTSPTERPHVPPTSGPHHGHHPVKGVPPHGYRRDGSTGPGTPRRYDEYSGGAMFPAAAALAQLHNHKSDSGWDSDGVSCNLIHTAAALAPTITNSGGQDWHSDHEGARMPRSSIELPPIQLSPADITSAPLPPLDSGRQRDLLPSIMSHSPPGRSSTLPPLHRPLGPSRPRKQSISKRGHHRRKSRGPGSDWLRRIQNDSSNGLLRPGSYDRKALSAEPTGDYGKRWEDLIDAATSATEDIDEDRTPVSLKFPSMLDPRLTSQMPQSPVSIQRSSLPPFSQNAFTNYQASPLQRALTPPSYNPEAPEPFPSVESGESGDNFHIESRGLSDSSPSYSSQNTQIYCAACQGISMLRESYACTECICGLCQACVDVLMGEQGARRKCPRCATIGGRFKPFQLDIR